MKKILSIFLMMFVATMTFAIAKDSSTKTTTEKKKNVTLVKSNQKTRVKKDVIKDDEYAQIKRAYFDADGTGDIYNCPVDKQRFCKVKDLDTGVYVLCDRETSRTQMESAKVFYKLGRCVKLN